MTTASATLPQLFTPEEIGKPYGWSAERVRRWCESGELRAINTAEKLSGQRARWRITMADWEEFLQRRANAPKPTPRRRRQAVDANEHRYF
jgi:hypothetical protein